MALVILLMQRLNREVAAIKVDRNLQSYAEVPRRELLFIKVAFRRFYHRIA